MNKPIGVMGCLPEMPDDFPMLYPENAGNMIHGRAPFEMFPKTSYYLNDDYLLTGRSSYTDFVNSSCSHLITTIANFITFDDDDGSKYSNFQRYLSSIEVPLVIFGLGAQAKTQDLDGLTVAPEAIELMRYLGNRCEVVGVRGEFTAKVFAHFAGVENTFVTGCPSFFQRPDQFSILRKNIKDNAPGRFAYSGTVLHNKVETDMLVRAIKDESFLVEPVSRFNHKLYLDSIVGEEDLEIPWYLRSHVGDGSGQITPEYLARYFRQSYKLFRNTRDWYKFNSDAVKFTYGTRFHVNMASILSGKPALWITHDSRTEELTDFLHVPNIPLDEASQMSPNELFAATNYEPLFDNLQGLYRNFNEYLDIMKLPNLELKF